jgi:hypothetical protein
MANMGMSERTIEGARRRERLAPQENPRLLDTKTEGGIYYDTKTPPQKEEADSLGQKPRRKLVFSRGAPPAPRYSADAGEEKNIVEKLPEISNEFFHSFRERTAKRGARDAGGAGNKTAPDDYEGECHDNG